MPVPICIDTTFKRENKMKNFYNYIKAFCLFSCCFLLAVFVLIVTMIVSSGQYEDLIIIPIFIPVLVLFFIMALFLLRYYRKMVIDVKFDGDNVLLITNKEIHSINNKHIVQVKEDFSTCITYIKYDDGKIKKDFKYQMKYFPFKTYRLNIDEMKKHMPYTEFI